MTQKEVKIKNLIKKEEKNKKDKNRKIMKNKNDQYIIN